MRYAFVNHGVVQEAWSRDPFELFDAGYAALFITCPDEVEQGWIYDGSTWAAPAPTPLLQSPKPTKEELLAQLQALHAQIMALE
jgi:hypothetical protein